MKIVIVGPGSVGLLFAGLFLKSKEEVWILDRDASRANRIRKSGIRIEGLTSVKIADPKITSDPDELKDSDFWFICVKSYDTKNVIKKIKECVSDSAFVVSLQNGVGNVELLAEAFGRDRVLAGVTNMGATLLAEGVVRHAGEGETVVGRLDGALCVGLKDLRELFGKSRIAIKISKDVMGILWSKLVINVGVNALSAVTRLKNGKLLDYEGARSIMREAVTEAVKVAKRKRIRLIYDDMLARTESVCEATADNISSMLQDVLNKKKTEIDFLNGVIVRQGESLGIKTPVNALLVDLIKTIESGYSFEVK
jgi:2-dehydropantoate 2-reductase